MAVCDTNPEGKEKKRVRILYAFLLSIAYVVIDAVAFILLAVPLGEIMPIQPSWLCNAVHSTIIAMVGTAVCCLSFFMVKGDTNLVPMGFGFFPVYAIICYAYAIFNLEGLDRQFMCVVITTYTLAPTIVGLTGAIFASRFIKRNRK